MVELLFVIVIIGILSAMSVGIFTELRARADKSVCAGNLKSLYVAAAAYVQDQGHWPQIDPRTIANEDDTHAKAWISAFNPYGVGEINWMCPTVTRIMESQQTGSDRPKQKRIDYLSTPFDDKPTTPYRWPRQPWFVERGSVHEGGNQLIYANGQCATLREALLLR